jgi:hypothetical protein
MQSMHAQEPGSHETESTCRPSTQAAFARRPSRAADWIAAFYLALILGAPWLVWAGPAVVPPAELSQLAPVLQPSNASLIR